MQRTGAIKRDEVGDIDQRIDGAQTNSRQVFLQPFGAWAVLDAFDEATGKDRTSVFATGFKFEFDTDMAVKLALNGRDVALTQATKACGGEIARHAIDAEAVRPVRRDGNLDHGVICTQCFRRRRADNPAIRQFDDAIMLVGEFQLALGTHHAV